MPSARNRTAAELAQQFKTAEAAEAETLLESLILQTAVPLVRQTVRRRFGSARNTTPEDFEDVCADAVAAIVFRLRRYRAGATEILDFENYSAIVASNTADRFFAARAPQRARLRNRIRYVLTTDACFVIEESECGVWLCRLRDKATGSAPRSAAARKLPELIREILSAASGPLELAELTTLAAHALGISDRTESVDDHAALLSDPAVTFAHSAELKDRLLWLWNELRQLPPSQRIALLLNLGSGGSGSSGAATLCVIADLGIATFGALAASLEMTEAELAAIWNRVPLPDNEIALRLRLERQQVINLRASARQRLTRRMTVIDNTESRTNTGEKPNTMGLSE